MIFRISEEGTIRWMGKKENCGGKKDGEGRSRRAGKIMMGRKEKGRARD